MTNTSNQQLKKDVISLNHKSFYIVLKVNFFKGVLAGF